MTKTYADLLREARAQIREVTPAARSTPCRPAPPRVVDVREASEWEQGHLPGAVHISQELHRAADRGGRRPIATRPVVLYCAGGVRSLFAAQTLAADGLHGRRLDDRRLPGLEDEGPRLAVPAVLTA